MARLYSAMEALSPSQRELVEKVYFEERKITDIAHEEGVSEACGELDDAGSHVYFTRLTVTPDDERAWFKMHPQWSKSNKYAELEAWIYI